MKCRKSELLILRSLMKYARRSVSNAVPGFCRPFINIEASGVNSASLKLALAAELAEKCPNLVSLNLSGCIRITSKGVLDVVDKCTKLKEINSDQFKYVNRYVYQWMDVNKPFLRKTGSQPYTASTGGAGRVRGSYCKICGFLGALR